MQSCSLKDNILFGRPYDEARYKQVIHDACLEADIEMLPYGDATDIGEKVSSSVEQYTQRSMLTLDDSQGVTLSGGQKQRVNIARTLYYDADIVLLDDPLSAVGTLHSHSSIDCDADGPNTLRFQVDAHVGKHLFDQAICGALANKTRLLVTHALHFLPRCDYIICLENVKITQEGTYADLVANKEGAFAELMEEFGGDLEEKKEEEEEKEEEAIEDMGEKPGKKEAKPAAKALMQEEERATGSVDKKGTLGTLFVKLQCRKTKFRLFRSLRSNLQALSRMDHLFGPHSVSHTTTSRSSRRFLHPSLVARRFVQPVVELL
jgi:ABC-type Fe3+/spermidine/putrescine transport system ATPase subunit